MMMLSFDFNAIFRTRNIQTEEKMLQFDLIKHEMLHNIRRENTPVPLMLMKNKRHHAPSTREFVLGQLFAMFLNCITNFIKKWQFKKNPFPFAHFVFCLMGSISIDAFFISSTALDIIILKCKYEAVIIRMPFLFSSQHKWCWKQQPQK